jgi:hypothetical protein
VDGHDVWVFDACGGPRFALETGAEDGVGGRVTSQDLQCAAHLESLVACVVDDTHAPAPAFADDLVTGEDLPGANPAALIGGAGGTGGRILPHRLQCRCAIGKIARWVNASQRWARAPRS